MYLSEQLKSAKQVTARAGEDLDHEEHDSIDAIGTNMYSHYGNKSGSFLRKLGIDIPQDPMMTEVVDRGFCPPGPAVIPSQGNT